MPKPREAKTVRVRNLHRTSRVNGIAPGAEGLVSEANAARYPMYFARLNVPATKAETRTEASREKMRAAAEVATTGLAAVEPKPKREKKTEPKG
jgi:hypothetical protein